MRSLIDQSYQRAEDIINTHRDQLDRITQALLEKETLERADFEALLAGADQIPAPEEDGSIDEEL
jgi:cell division protease FtsH